jgi:hypothetical protein
MDDASVGMAQLECGRAAINDFNILEINLRGR